MQLVTSIPLTKAKEICSTLLKLSATLLTNAPLAKLYALTTLAERQNVLLLALDSCFLCNPAMSANYKRLVKILEKWPIDSTKKGR